MAGGRPQAALHGRRTAPGRSPRSAEGPRPLSTAGGRPQVALHGRRTAPSRSPRPADGPRSLSTAGGRPQAALHGRQTAPGRSPRPVDGPTPLSTAGRWPQAALHGRQTTPVELRIVGHELLPASSIGLSALLIAELLENLSVRQNLFHISQELATTTV